MSHVIQQRKDDWAMFHLALLILIASLGIHGFVARVVNYLLVYSTFPTAFSTIRWLSIKSSTIRWLSTKFSTIRWLSTNPITIRWLSTKGSAEKSRRAYTMKVATKRNLQCLRGQNLRFFLGKSWSEALQCSKTQAKATPSAVHTEQRWPNNFRKLPLSVFLCEKKTVFFSFARVIPVIDPHNGHAMIRTGLQCLVSQISKVVNLYLGKEFFRGEHRTTPTHSTKRVIPRPFCEYSPHRLSLEAI